MPTLAPPLAPSTAPPRAVYAHARTSPLAPSTAPPRLSMPTVAPHPSLHPPCPPGPSMPMLALWIAPFVPSTPAFAPHAPLTPQPFAPAVSAPSTCTPSTSRTNRCRHVAACHRGRRDNMLCRWQCARHGEGCGQGHVGKASSVAQTCGCQGLSGQQSIVYGGVTCPGLSTNLNSDRT